MKWYLTPKTIFFKIPYETNIIWWVSLQSIFLIWYHICHQAFLHCFSLCVSSDWPKEKKHIHSVCKCRLLFDPPIYPTFGRSQSQGLKPRVGFSGNIQLAHFTAELAWAAFRHASLNSWNSFTPTAVEWISFFLQNIEAPTLPPEIFFFYQLWKLMVRSSDSDAVFPRVMQWKIPQCAVISPGLIFKATSFGPLSLKDFRFA